MPDAIFRSEADVARMLEAFEIKHNLFAMQVRGVSLWQLVRFSVGVSLQNLPLSGAAVPKMDLLWSVFRSIWDLLTLSGSYRYIAKSYSSALRVQVNSEIYEDIYFEELLKNIEKGVRVYSVNASGYMGRKSAVKSSVDCTALDVAVTILRRLLPVRDDSEVFSQLSLLLRNELGYPSSEKFLRDAFNSFWWRSRLYGWLIKKTGVKTILVANAGELAIIFACRKNNVQFIEIQHGIYTADHPNTPPLSVSVNHSREALLEPDIVAVYGQYWCDIHNQMGRESKSKIVPVGASIIEKYRVYRNCSFIANMDCPRLVFTSQGLAVNELVCFLRQALDFMVKPCKLTIKLHPAYDQDTRSIYTNALGKDSRVEIIGGQDDPNTYELIALADMHISIASACHYDALSIGTPTMVIGLPGHQLVMPLVECGDGLFAMNAKKMAHIIDGRAWVAPSMETQAKYCQQGFSENLLALMA